MGSSLTSWLLLPGLVLVEVWTIMFLLVWGRGWPGGVCGGQGEWGLPESLLEDFKGMNPQICLKETTASIILGTSVP